ncbi:GIY-YIG nuclease family protein [Enteractinococcus coprophilus]|uniref:GIY-YIG catalytic domain-containing protein n=1 Tax=Enteractinococcus coprophilus TaxID=1027633 RepID=A0A543AGD4_9MICC|nr:GIY-YIG nuclease family protein [Enteractinococcus coprophilus]TQL71643.1 GIY-YIG catalytic domain-containing protein [Enteractinococcus coprophilus]
MSPVFSEKSFDSYDVRARRSFAPFVQGRSSGIYIFEFDNGQRYVGQTVNFVGRFNSHIRGSDHHEAWEDISRLMVMDAKPEELNELEFQIIAWQKEQGYSLRNKVFNFGFEGPSQLDSDIPIIDQLHWANGDSDYDISDIRDAADRPLEGRTKLHRSPEGRQPWMNEHADDDSWPTVANAVCADLGAVISRAIPEAVELESIYWTVSDYPNTVGGRLATLNVGRVEVLYIPREPVDLIRGGSEPVKIHCSFLNMAAGTVTDDGELQSRWQNTPLFISSMTRQPTYGIGAVDNVTIPTGLVGQALDHPDILQGVREFCLNLMRSGQSGIFRRWHSRELARRAYEEHIRVTEQDGSYQL